MIKAKETIPARRAPAPVLNGSKVSPYRSKGRAKGFKHSPETIAKITASNTDNPKLVGRIPSPETRALMSAAQKGSVKKKRAPAVSQTVCSECKRPFPMTPAERQRKRRAKIAKLNKARK